MKQPQFGTVQQVRVVTAGDLEERVRTVYGRDWSASGDQNACVDSLSLFTVSGRVTKREEIKLARFKKGEPVDCMLPVLLNDLAHFGHIPCDTYLIVF